MKTDEFIESLDGELTPEQVEQLLHGEVIDEEPAESKQGDTDTPAEELENVGEEDADDSVPSTDDASKGDDEHKGEQVSEEELNAENAAILARDGKHLIGYEKLVEARQQAQLAKQQADEAREELQRLREEADEKALNNEDPTKQEQTAMAEAAIKAGADPDLFGDFSEEALKVGIQKLVDEQVSARVSEALKPVQEREQEHVNDAHYNSIYEAHPDADSIIESQQLMEWMTAQPSFSQAAMQQVLQGGTAEQVIELFDTFKAATQAPETITQNKSQILKR